MAAQGAGLEGPRAAAEYTPHYELRALVNQMRLNHRINGVSGSGITDLDVALRQQAIAVGADSSIDSPVRVLDMGSEVIHGAQPADPDLQPTVLRSTARTRPRKQAHPKRLYEDMSDFPQLE